MCTHVVLYLSATICFYAGGDVISIEAASFRGRTGGAAVAAVAALFSSVM